MELFTGNKEVNGPTIYVAGKLGNLEKKNFYVAGYGVHWANNKEFNDQCVRYSQPPITLYRTQLSAILLALQQVNFTEKIDFFFLIGNCKKLHRCKYCYGLWNVFKTF